MINGAQEVGFLLLQRQISLSAIRALLSIMVTNYEAVKNFNSMLCTSKTLLLTFL